MSTNSKEIVVKDSIDFMVPFQFKMGNDAIALARILQVKGPILQDEWTIHPKVTGVRDKVDLEVRISTNVGRNHIILKVLSPSMTSPDEISLTIMEVVGGSTFYATGMDMACTGHYECQHDGTEETIEFKLHFQQSAHVV